MVLEVLKKGNFMTFQPGYYTIKAKHSNLFMAVSISLKTDNALIVQWENQNNDEQKFKIVSREGYYSIEPKHSKKVLAIAGASALPGAWAIQYEWQSGKEQKFNIEQGKDGFYKIIAAHSKQVLAVGGGSKSKGAQVIQWSDGGYDDQKWEIKCVEPFSPEGKIPWTVCLHFSEIKKDPLKPLSDDNPYSIENAKKAFTKIKDLGATMVRTDFNWNDVQPKMTALTEPEDKIVWDENKLAFMKDYLNTAKSYGLSVLCILFQAPEWTRNLSMDDKCQHFKRYCKKIAQLTKGDIQHYQLWNEPNNLYLIKPPIGDMTAAEFASLAIAGDKALREVLGDTYTSWINLNCNIFNWRAFLELYFKEMNRLDEKHKINIGIDHYPGTWGCFMGYGAWYEWSPLDVLVNEFINNPKSSCFGKLGAIMETGYSTPPDSAMWSNHDESAQKHWIYNHPASSLTELYMKIHSYRKTYKKDFIPFCTWYSLIDSNTGQSLSISSGAEENFGILHTNQSEKKGYGTLKTLMRGYANGNLDL